MDTERFEHLLNLYFDQALSAGEKAELEGMLLEFPAARTLFWECAHWHGFLREWGQQEWGRREAAEVPAVQRPMPAILPKPPHVAAPPRGPVYRPRPARPIPRAASHSWWPLAAAAALLLAGFGWWQYSNLFQHPAPSETVSDGIATLTHAASVVWADGSSTHRSGEVLSAGWLKVKSGAFQVEFSRGARAVVQGPAEFEVLSDNAGALRFGRVAVTVPAPAHGFNLRAPKFSVIDYGTQFGCFLPMTGAPEIHVFRGAVGLEAALTPAKPVKEELRANQAVRLVGGQLEAIPPNPGAFMTEEQLARLDDERSRVRLEAWRQWSHTFSQHPGLLVHFDFENDDAALADHILTNRAPSAPAETNGTIIGCDWTEGRWPGKGALQFRRSNDRVRLSLPGEYQAITFLAWVRADGVPFRENSLVMAEDHNQLGEASWYLFRDGSLGWGSRSARRGAAEQWLHVNSAPVFRGGGLDSWRLAATVYDGATVAHYFDGKLIGSAPAHSATPLRFGHFEVGNWSANSPQDDPRMGSTARVDRDIIGNFFGGIDELAILSVPLSAGEIQEIFLQGRPGQN